MDGLLKRGYIIGFFSVLALIFIVLKLCDVIAWSWLWLPLIFFGDIVLVLVAIGFFASLVSLYSKIFKS